MWHHFWMKMPMCNCTWACPCCSSSLFFLIIYWASFIQCSYSFFSFSFLLSFVFFIFIFIFFPRLDFYFFNKFRWFIFFFWLFITFFVLIGHHFFNNDICTNLYTLTFSIPPLFHSQANKKREKLKYFLSSHFSTPPTKWTIKRFSLSHFSLLIIFFFPDQTFLIKLTWWFF